MTFDRPAEPLGLTANSQTDSFSQENQNRCKMNDFWVGEENSSFVFIVHIIIIGSKNIGGIYNTRTLKTYLSGQTVYRLLLSIKSCCVVVLIIHHS